MKLFHCFPRPRALKESALTNWNEDITKLVLQSILEYGVLCTPERLRVFASPQTDNEKKKEDLLRGNPEYVHTQSRFCLTLCSESELFEPKIRGITPRANGPAIGDKKCLSHADLFGPCAISFEPMVSRRLGIVPTNYFAPGDMFGNRYAPSGGEAPGLNIQMIHRLKELRELLIILAMIESSMPVGEVTLPGQDALQALGLTLPYEQKILRLIKELNFRERKNIFELFNIDREIALNLISFVEMMLSLYQETDSTIDGAVLAFYEQREWRLIHHMRLGAVWYCLGGQPEFRNPLAGSRQEEI
jgi:hypothetical protein